MLLVVWRRLPGGELVAVLVLAKGMADHAENSGGARDWLCGEAPERSGRPPPSRAQRTWRLLRLSAALTAAAPAATRNACLLNF